MDEEGHPYDYIVVIDAGSKGSRANVYRTRYFSKPKLSTRTWKAEDDDDYGIVQKDGVSKYPEIICMNSKNVKKIKPGIASFIDNLKKLRKQYMGKLLKDVLKYIPKDQVYRTPIFLHGTGGMRLLKPEDQKKILGEICDYVSSKFDFYLPDCDSHINSISGELEGLYSWIGVNYKYGVLGADSKIGSFGILDMGGVSSQIALEPNITDNSGDQQRDYLFKLHLGYEGDLDGLNDFNVFSESFLGGMNQIHTKYDELLIQQNDTKDPCLPKNFVKMIPFNEVENQLTGSGEFFECLDSLNTLLTSITTTKSCNLTSSTSSVSSCLLSDSMPFLNFNIEKFIGINGFYSNLKNFMNYKQFYEKTNKLCSSQYTDLLNKDSDTDKTSELCFKSSWIINVLHNGLGFPRYGIDTDDKSTDSLPTFENSFKILDEFSWTLGRAVLYSYYETAQRILDIENPMIGYYEPSSSIFQYGGELPGIPSRPVYEFNQKGKGHGSDDDDNDTDDEDDDDDDDWDDVLEEHRLWGSLLFLMILLLVGYLLLGKTKRQSIVDTVKKLYRDKFRSRYAAVENQVEEEEDEQVNDELNTLESRDDSFEV